MTAIKATTKTARELVLGIYPDAFVHDEDGSVSIRLPENEVVVCPACNHPYERPKHPDFLQVLGSAGNADSAWADAAWNLKLTGFKSRAKA